MKQSKPTTVIVIGIVLMVSGLSIGPTIGGQRLNTTGSIAPTNPVTTRADVYSLLIITPTIFQQALQPLVIHKNAMGLPTKLVTLDKVYRQMYWHGRDDAEKIKYFIKTAIEEWGIKYVLLVGGRSSQVRPTWYCPVRYVKMVDDWDAEYLSDLYFADIYDANGNFSSWDNNNGIFGEWFTWADRAGYRHRSYPGRCGWTSSLPQCHGSQDHCSENHYL